MSNFTLKLSEDKTYQFAIEGHNNKPISLNITLEASKWYSYGGVWDAETGEQLKELQESASPVSFATTNWKDAPCKPGYRTQGEWDAVNSSGFNGFPFPIEIVEESAPALSLKPFQRMTLPVEDAIELFWRVKNFNFKINESNTLLNLDFDSRVSLYYIYPNASDGGCVNQPCETNTDEPPQSITLYRVNSSSSEIAEAEIPTSKDSKISIKIDEYYTCPASSNNWFSRGGGIEITMDFGRLALMKSTGTAIIPLVVTNFDYNEGSSIPIISEECGCEYFPSSLELEYPPFSGSSITLNKSGCDYTSEEVSILNQDGYKVVGYVDKFLKEFYPKLGSKLTGDYSKIFKHVYRPFDKDFIDTNSHGCSASEVAKYGDIFIPKILRSDGNITLPNSVTAHVTPFYDYFYRSVRLNLVDSSYYRGRTSYSDEDNAYSTPFRWSADADVFLYRAGTYYGNWEWWECRVDLDTKSLSIWDIDPSYPAEDSSKCSLFNYFIAEFVNTGSRRPLISSWAQAGEDCYYGNYSGLDAQSDPNSPLGLYFDSYYGLPCPIEYYCSFDYISDVHGLPIPLFGAYVTA